MSDAGHRRSSTLRRVLVGGFALTLVAAACGMSSRSASIETSNLAVSSATDVVGGTIASRVDATIVAVSARRIVLPFGSRSLAGTGLWLGLTAVRRAIASG